MFNRQRFFQRHDVFKHTHRGRFVTPPATAAQHADSGALAKGAGTNLLGHVGGISQALATLVIVKAFGVVVLGKYAVAWMFIRLITRAVGLGQDPAVVYHLNKTGTNQNPNAVGRLVGSSVVVVLSAGILAAVALWVGVDFAASKIFGDRSLSVPFRIFAFALPGTALTALLLAASRARKIMKYQVYASAFIQPFLFLVGSLVAWWSDAGLAGIAWAQVAAVWITAVVSLGYYRKQFPLIPLLRGMVRPRGLGGLLRYGVPLSGKGMLALAVSRADLFLVGNMLGFAAAGVFSVVADVAQLIRAARVALEPILAPLVAEQHHRDDMERMADTYGRATRWALVISLGYLGAVALAGDTILNIYGPEFSVGAAALTILLFGQVINGSFGLSETALINIGHPGTVMFNMGALLALTVALDVLFIQLWGLNGAALGTATAITVVTMVQVFQVQIKASIHPWHMSLLKPVAAFSAAVLVAWLTPLWSLPQMVDQIVRASIFVLLYGLALAKIGLDSDEKRIASSLSARVRRVSSKRGLSSDVTTGRSAAQERAGKNL